MVTFQGAQATPDLQNIGIDATTESRDSSTSYELSVHEVECQTQVDCQEIGVGEALQMADIEVQYEQNTRDVGIQPSVSAFKLKDKQKEVAEELVILTNLTLFKLQSF